MYWVVIKGKVEGPYSLEQLMSVPVAADTFIKARGMADFKELQELPELSALFGVKAKEAPLPQYYAGPDTRMLASLIDHLLLLGLYLVLLTIVLPFFKESYLRIALALSGVPAIPLLKIIIGVFMESSSWQATFGKRWLGIKVCDITGKRLRFGQSLFRNILKLLTLLTLGLGFFSSFFHRRHQALHDIISACLVIKGRLL